MKPKTTPIDPASEAYAPVKPKRARKPPTPDQLAVALHDALGPYEIDLKKAKKLLAAGANPNATRPATPGMRAFPWTSLHSVMNHTGMVTGNDTGPAAEMLLAAGADPMLGAHGGLPIHTAASNGHPAFIGMLARRGFDLDILDSNGMTALHWAAFHGEHETARELIKHGARVDLLDAQGCSPLRLAAGSVGARSAKTALLLMAAGADPTLAALDGSTAISAATDAWAKHADTPSGVEASAMSLSALGPTPIRPDEDRSALPALRALAEARELSGDTKIASSHSRPGL